jgi:hypothetical protein
MTRCRTAAARTLRRTRGVGMMERIQERELTFSGLGQPPSFAIFLGDCGKRFRSCVHFDTQTRVARNRDDEALKKSEKAKRQMRFYSEGWRFPQSRTQMNRGAEDGLWQRTSRSFVTPYVRSTFVTPKYFPRRRVVCTGRGRLSTMGNRSSLTMVRELLRSKRRTHSPVTSP